MHQTHAFKLALGAMWTAGLQPSNAEKLDLFYRCDPPIFEPDAVVEKAISVLSDMGYRIAANPSGYHLLERVHDLIPQDGPPSAGHGVKTYGSRLFKDDEITFAQGIVGQLRRGYALTARGSITCMPLNGTPTKHSFSLSSGGPSMIGYIETTRFRRTSETTEVCVWNFGFTPEANGAVYFMLKVPVWTYICDDRDEIFDPECELPPKWTETSCLNAPKGSRKRKA